MTKSTLRKVQNRYGLVFFVLSVNACKAVQLWLLLYNWSVANGCWSVDSYSCSIMQADDDGDARSAPALCR